jgi:hypothetical protein
MVLECDRLLTKCIVLRGFSMDRTMVQPGSELP